MKLRFFSKNKVVHESIHIEQTIGKSQDTCLIHGVKTVSDILI